VSVGHMHCSVPSGSRAETAAGCNYFLGLFRGSSPPTRPGETSRNLMQVRPVRWTRSAESLPQLKSRERAAHTETVSEHAFGQSRQKFSRQLKRISVLTDSLVRVSRPQPRSGSPCTRSVWDLPPHQPGRRCARKFERVRGPPDFAAGDRLVPHQRFDRRLQGGFSRAFAKPHGHHAGAAHGAEPEGATADRPGSCP
jgi:hypothetical protein